MKSKFMAAMSTPGLSLLMALALLSGGPLLAWVQPGTPSPSATALEPIAVEDSADLFGDAPANRLAPQLFFSKIVDDDTPDPGQLITYTLVISNGEPIDVTQAVISDSLASGLTFAGPVTLDPPGAGMPGTAPPTLVTSLTITAGQWVTVTYPVTVNIGLGGSTVITNTAAITWAQATLPQTDTATITVNNVAPLAIDDAYTTTEDVALSVPAAGVLINDTDPNGDLLTAVKDSDPISGTLMLSADGSLVYTPALDYSGVATFTYHAHDGTESSNIATVVITTMAENDAPVAWGDAYSTIEDMPMFVPPPGVLDNDEDVDGDLLTAVKDSDPVSGTLTLNADGSVIYTPIPDYYGVVTFTYHAHDEIEDSNVVTVLITVRGENDAPLAVDNVYTTTKDATLIVPPPGVLGNDEDADDDLLMAIGESEPISGTLALSADGSFAYTPTLDYCGVVTFTYYAHDGDLESNVATVTITMTLTRYRIYLPVILR